MFLDIFALVVIVLLVAVIVIGALLIGALPGRIARRRGHPQADAISVCGWLGLLTLGLLWPVAMIWAHLKPAGDNAPLATRVEALEGELNRLRGAKGGEA
jgi:hypothetical protein